jgi:hypothetical protein
MPATWFRRTIALWLPTAGVATVLVVALSAAVQQVQRTDADDPQLQMARDAATALAAGTPPATVAGQGRVDIERSLAPWIAIYDVSGTPVASSGVFRGRPPVIPDQARADAAGGERSFTWQPTDVLRMATVVEPYAGGTVVAARSMQAVEQREGRTVAIAGVAWLAALVVGFLGAGLGVWAGGRATSAD